MFKHMGAISSFGLILGFALGSPAHAATQVVTGIVENIYDFDAGSTDSDYAELSGVTSLGTCPVDPDTKWVRFRFVGNPDGTNPSANRIYAILFTSYTHRNTTVTIHTNDASGLLNGDCAINYISLDPT